MVYIEENNILTPHQSGFRPTDDVLLHNLQDWRQAVNKDKVVVSVFINFSKVFDMISHQLLFKKLPGSRNQW